MRPAPKKLGRRELGLAASALSLGWLGGFGCTRPIAPPPRPGPRAALVPPLAPGEVEVWSVFDLPREDPGSRELSGATWEEATRTLWAVQDELASIVPLRPDAELRRWTFGERISLDVTGPLDLEGIALAKDGFVLASELGPRLIEVDRHGRHKKDIPPPAKFFKAHQNKSFESLALDPGKTVLYTTSETSLPGDDAAGRDGGGPRVRIVRMDLATGSVNEHAYATDAVASGGDSGVSDIAAIGADHLLVLERGFHEGVGNSARIYEVDLANPVASCDAIEELSSATAVLPKRLVVDLSKLAATGASATRQPQPTALMENYEGLTLGPRLPDGRRSLLLVSDDNARAIQTPRVLTLALR